MLYRQYGKTGIKISSLGFGGMRFPQSDEETTILVRKAIDNGINYIDTAYGYGESERKLGLALQEGYRDKVYISTKNPLWEGQTIEEWEKRLETSLERMQTDHIDFYNIIHSMEYKQYEEFLLKDKNLEKILKYRDQGVFKHVVFSTHDTPGNVIKIIDTGLFEGVTIQYNIMNRDYEDAIAYAHEKGLGVVVMGPVAGGILGVSGEKGFAGRLRGQAATAELAVRFVLSNPNVTCALSGMSDEKMLFENIETVSKDPKLSQEELDNVISVAKDLKDLSNLYCTGCRYCMPCPNDVDIPGCFGAYNVANVYGAVDAAKGSYGWIKTVTGSKKDNSASNCIQCGVCMDKCPQKINIIKQLEEVNNYFNKLSN